MCAILVVFNAWGKVNSCLVGHKMLKPKLRHVLEVYDVVYLQAAHNIWNM